MKRKGDRKSTRLNSSHTEIYTLSLHDALPIYQLFFNLNVQFHMLSFFQLLGQFLLHIGHVIDEKKRRSEEHTSELQSHRDLHSFPTRRSSDLSTLLQS